MSEDGSTSWDWRASRGTARPASEAPPSGPLPSAPSHQAAPPSGAASLSATPRPASSFGHASSSTPRLSHEPVAPAPPMQEHRRFRSRPLRPGGGRVGAGLGLLGLLVTVVIMGILGAKVVSSLGGSSTVTIPGRLPAAGSSDPASTGAADGQVAAGDVACRIERRTIETAAQAYQAINGEPPADMAALLQEGLLSADAEPFEYVVVAGAVEPESTGGCAGR